MTDRYTEWLSYTMQVDQLFTGLGLTVVITVVVGWIIWRASLKVFKIMVKIALFMVLFGAIAAWLLDCCL